MASADLVYRFLGIDAGAGAQFDRMAGKTAALGRSSNVAFAAVTKLTAGAAALVAVIDTASVRAAANFQTQLTRIHTQADASTKTVAQLRTGILNMTTAVATAPEQLAAAAFHIASVAQKSLSAAQQLHILRIAAEGAKIGGADLVDVTNSLDAAIVSGMPGVKNYAQAMGVLNATVGAGDMTMQNLADAFGPLGATFKGFNVNLKQTGAALAVFGDNNIRGADAGTQLRMAVMALSKPVKDGAAQLKAWGIHSGSLANQLRHGGLTDALDTLYRKLKGAGVTAKEVGPFLTEMFGKRAGVGLNILIGELERYHQKLREVSKGSGGFASSWKGYTKTFQYSFDQMRAAVEKFAIKIGTALMPSATKLVSWVTNHFLPAAASMVTWINRHILPALVAVGKILGGALNWAFHQIAGTVRNNLDGFKTLGTVLKVLGEATLWLAGQFGHILVGVLRTVIAFVGEVGKAFHALADFFTGTFPRAVGAVVKFWANGMKLMADVAFGFFSFFVHAADKALGWLPFGVGSAVHKGVAAFDAFRSNVDSTLSGIANDAASWGQKTGTAYASNFAASASAAEYTAAVLANNILSANAAEVGVVGASGYETTTQAYSRYHHKKKGGGYNLPGGPGIPVSGGGAGAASKTAKSAARALHITAQSLVKALASGLMNGWQGFSLTVEDSLSTGTRNLLNQLQKQFKTVTDGMAKLVKDARTKLANDLKAQTQFVQQMMSDAALTNVPTVDSGYTGQTTRLTDLGSFLGGQAKSYAVFAKDLRRLAGLGLSKGLLSQIANMGPTAGLQYAQQILANPGMVSQINAYQKQIQTSAKAIGQDQYGSQIQADRRNLHRQTELQERMARRLDHLAREIGQEVRRELGPLLAKGLTGKQTGLTPHEVQQLERDINRYKRRMGK